MTVILADKAQQDAIAEINRNKLEFLSKFSILRITHHWNNLQRNIVVSLLEVFKSRLYPKDTIFPGFMSSMWELQTAVL